MGRISKQTEILAVPEPSNLKAEIYYRSNDGEECLKVKNLTISNILELRRMFHAYKITIENESK